MKASVTLQDVALVQTQGGTVGATVEYPGFSNRRNAERAAQRDLRALATPLLSCTVYCGQEAADLDIGDTFKLEWPDYHEGAIIMRVTGMAFGDGRTDRIRIDCVEDVFGQPEAAILSDGRGSLWTNPTAPPDNIEVIPADSELVAATTQIAEELPYRLLVNEVGPRQIDVYMAETPDVGILATSGKRPLSGLQDGVYYGNAINALIHVDAGSGYEQNGAAGFSPFARLVNDIEFLTTDLLVNEAQDLSAVEIGSFAQIDDELVRVDAIETTSEGVVVTVGRGILDTVPAPHLAGTSILFWQQFAGTNATEYEATESINVKLQPRNNSGAAPLASAIAMPLTFDSRAIRPYPPGNVKINGVAYPVTDLGGAPLVVTWSHRDRLQQTGATFEDTTATNIGPEAGTTYTVRLEDSLGGVLAEETGITGTEWAEQSDASDTDNEIVVKLWSVRDGYASWQQHVIPVLREAPVDSSSSEILGALATGGDISFYEDGGTNYAVHIFNGSGTFEPLVPLDVDYIIVAGGGAGGRSLEGNRSGGGGGAGGVVEKVSVSLSASPYSVVIGGGGAGTTSDANGGNGTGSSAFGDTATGGGGGGRARAAAGATGSSGGSGGGGQDAAGGSGVSGQGSAGGSSNNGGTPGGGGGYSAAGQNGTVSPTVSGSGGAGFTETLSGQSLGLAGGGGAGSNAPASWPPGSATDGGGEGGGATGFGQAGAVNTGGGGGGSSRRDEAGVDATRIGGAGGSGIVIIRYEI